MPYDFGPQQAISYLMDEYGLPKHIAAGIAGNISVESGFDAGINEADPLVEGSRGGYGIYQATGPRREDMEAFLSGDLENPYRQLDFMMHEMDTTEKAARDRLMEAKNVDEAARVMSERFLRPGIPHLERRINAARRYAGLEPMAPGPTRQRAGLGLPLQRRPQSRPELPEDQWMQDEYADNWIGRVQEKRDTMRQNVGQKLGLNKSQTGALGEGLQGLGQYLMRGGIG